MRACASLRIVALVRASAPLPPAADHTPPPARPPARARARAQVRGALKFSSMASMLLAFEFLLNTPSLRILRVKDRFTAPTAGGWADCLVNLEFTGDAALAGHVCELQFVHKSLFFVRDRMGAHHGYDVFRSAAELLEAGWREPV